MNDLICDGNSVFARSWFAAAHDSGRDDPVKAVQFAAGTVLNILNPEATFIGVRFDRTFFGWDHRQNKSKQRAEKPPEYHATKDVFKEVLSTMLGTVHCEHVDFEGDDIVATAVYSRKASDIVYVASGDKDLMQLACPGVHYYCLNTKAVLSPLTITTKFRVKRPNQVALALAILGDKVDNVAGIHGWGPKKVIKLFESVAENMTFEQAFEAIDAQVPEDRKQEFYESLDRVLLKIDAPGVLPPAQLALADPSAIDAYDLPELSLKYEDVYRAYDR